MAETSVRDVVDELEISDDEADALIARYIRRDDVRLGRHEAHAVDDRGGGPPVWRLLLVLRIESVDAVADAYDLPREAVIAAIAFYRRHRQLFDAKLLLEAEADADHEHRADFEL
ncbi:MAG TPA: hypothetical protein VH482_23020 [Thermomicrobiales bacterium]|jgi:hypothetical protein